MSNNTLPAPAPGHGCYDARKELPPCTAGHWKSKPTAWCVPCKNANPELVAAAFEEHVELTTRIPLGRHVVPWRHAQ